MANEAMDRCEFERLMSRINQETSSTDRKLDILYTSRGYFSALQASRLLYAFSISTDRLKAMEMLEPRLCRMSGREARDVLGAFNIQNDKVRALDILKRYLIDTQVRDGIAYILSCFCFEDHKMKALAILRTVRADTFDHVPAGGHCIYAPVGAVCNQSRPLKPSLFQTLYEDSQTAPGQGKILVPTLARPRLLPSKYTGHPSYAYPSGRDYAEDRKFPGCGAFGKQLYHLDPHTGECPAKCPLFAHYPSGGPPLGMHFPNGAVGFQTDTTYN